LAAVVQAQEKAEKEEKKAATQKQLENMLKAIVSDVKKQEEVEVKVSKPYELEIDGLIIDETKTKIGRDFYDIFYTNWQRPPNISGFTVFIREMATPRSGSWVWVIVDESIIYQTIIRPRYDIIEEAARYSVAAAHRYLVQTSQDQRQLSGEDMAGSGIY
jgi:curli production assembly/transport component CsgE